MAIHETLDIEKFDGLGDYASWKDTSLTVLKAKHCHGAVLEDKHVQNGRGKYVWLMTANEEEDSTAKLYLAQLLTSNINRYARGCTANELWEKLDSVYSLVNTSTSLDVVADMIKLHMKPVRSMVLLHLTTMPQQQVRQTNSMCVHTVTGLGILLTTASKSLEICAIMAMAVVDKATKIVTTARIMAARKASSNCVSVVLPSLVAMLLLQSLVVEMPGFWIQVPMP
ncbi:hypothetical protein J3B01_000586 [Coemansia erecta]|nr:hypothetical protein J3B01_000586 [Coemansia erecta]